MVKFYLSVDRRGSQYQLLSFSKLHHNFPLITYQDILLFCTFTVLYSIAGMSVVTAHANIQVLSQEPIEPFSATTHTQTTGASRDLSGWSTHIEAARNQIHSNTSCSALVRTRMATHYNKCHQVEVVAIGDPVSYGALPLGCCGWLIPQKKN